MGAAPGTGQPADPKITLAPGVTVVVDGQALRSDGGYVQIDGGPPVTPSQASDSRLWFPLPSGLSPGIRSLEVAQPFVIGTPPTPHPGLTSPAFPFVLPPTVISASATDVTPPASPHTAMVSVTLNLTVGTAQKVRILLTNRVDDTPVAYPAADPLDARPRGHRSRHDPGVPARRAGSSGSRSDRGPAGDDLAPRLGSDLLARWWPIP